MKTILKLLIVCGIIVLTAFSCEKTEEEVLPTSQAEGKIIMTFRACYGYWVMIEVENPKGIGVEGTFAFPFDEQSRINYKNAIGVPYFERVPDLSTEAPDTIGTWLKFNYRKLTDEERNSKIFVDTSYHGICLSNIAPPYVNMYMITKIIDYH
ncbi:MAG: hypothetical protein J7L04_07570 [Bacteroidales bacterium]|nr:hypothetical protein [Bacteroidales bacterium]